jgi:hypothetical protein
MSVRFLFPGGSISSFAFGSHFSIFFSESSSRSGLENIPAAFIKTVRCSFGYQIFGQYQYLSCDSDASLNF